MFSKFKPTWMMEAIYQITPEQLQEQGIKAVLTDLDNTLIAWNNPDGTEELRDWLKIMREAEIPVIVVSNNSAERVDRAVSRFDLKFESRALKPLTFGLKRALKHLGLSNKEVVMVGDQLITDIRGANAAGIPTILVKPIVDTDAWNTRFNRFMERKIMRHLKNRNPEMTWQEGIK